MLTKLCLRYLFALTIILLSATANAQYYPSKTVRLIVPFAPGGPSDIVARVIASRFSEVFGQQAIVENRPGAGGNIGIVAVARAAPDGYTLLVVSSALMVNSSLFVNPGYEPMKDFQPITLAGFSSNILTAHPSSSVKTPKDLITYARANPGKVSFASSGAGSTPHLAGEVFNLAAGLDMVNVPYNGAGPAVQAVLSNQVQFGFTAITPVVQLVKSGRLRALAVTTATRSAALPEVPTLGELGFTDQETDTVQGFLAPAGVSQSVITKLHAGLTKILQLPETKERFAEIGFEIVANTPDEYSALIRTQTERYGRVIRKLNMKLD